MDKSAPWVNVWHHSAEPRDAKTVTLETDLSIILCTSHSCQILILFWSICLVYFKLTLFALHSCDSEPYANRFWKSCTKYE